MANANLGEAARGEVSEALQVSSSGTGCRQPHGNVQVSGETHNPGSQSEDRWLWPPSTAQGSVEPSPPHKDRKMGLNCLLAQKPKGPPGRVALADGAPCSAALAAASLRAGVSARWQRVKRGGRRHDPLGLFAQTAGISQNPLPSLPVLRNEGQSVLQLVTEAHTGSFNRSPQPGPGSGQKRSPAWKKNNTHKVSL